MLKRAFDKNRSLSCVLLGLLVCAVVTAAMTVFYARSFPEEKLSFQELLAGADLQNYSVQENGLLSTTTDPMIIIPLPLEGNDVKAIRIRIDETSGYNDYWAQVFLYDDCEWVVRDLMVKTGTTDFVLTGSTRTDDYRFLRLDLCCVEQVFMSLESITINPLPVLLKLSLVCGLLCGSCTSILLVVILAVRKKAWKRPVLPAAPEEAASEPTCPAEKEDRPLIQKHALGLSDHLLCALLSLGFTASPRYIREGTCRIDLSFVLSASVLFAVFLCLAWLLRSRMARQGTIVLPGGSAFERLLNQKHSCFKAGLIIFACWLPLLLMLYPGTAINDTWGELHQYVVFSQKHGYLTDHHPFFDTLLLGSMIVPAASATGKWHVVFFVYTLLQSLATCFSFAYVICYARRKLGLGANAVFFMFLIYCFLPLFPLSAQTIGKDAISAWIFVLYTVQYIEIVRTKGKALKNRRFLGPFLLLAILLCLTKKVNVYIVLLSLILFVVCERKAFREAVASLICMLLISLLVLPSVQTALNVYSGGKQEMFSLPFQMTARYVREYPDDITEEEYAVIDRVLTMDDLAERYDPLLADPVKEYQQKGNDADYSRYIRVWIAQGLRHPDAYIHAANAMLSGWFSWERYVPLMDMDWHNQLDPEMIPEWVPYRGWSQGTAEAMEKLFDGLYGVPLVSILFTYGLYASIIPAFVVATVCRYRKKNGIKYWLGAVPTLASLVLGCWLAPASIQMEGMRYLYPVTYTIPLLLLWCLFIYQQLRSENPKTAEEKDKP